MKQPLGYSLRSKLGLLLVALFALVGAGVLAAVLRGVGSYSNEVNHRLNHEAAAHIASTLDAFKPSGEVNSTALMDIFMKVMVVNPTLEVYLVDLKGQVLAFDAPEEKILRRQVDVKVVQSYLDAGGLELVLGDDPRSLTGHKPISAAPVERDGELAGYLYIILGGEAFDGVIGVWQESYILRWGIGLILAVFFVVAVVGLGALGALTRPLERLRTGMQDFRDEGQVTALAVKGHDEIGALTFGFNEMAERIAGQVELLRVTDEERRRFVANISHDLRTPTATIQGYLETLLIKSGGLDATERERYLRIALGQVERLGTLVDGLFELARLEARDVEPVREVFSLAELLSDVVAKFSVAAKQAEIELHLVLSPGESFDVCGDLGLFERVFDNLLQNALRHGPGGTAVTVSVDCRGEWVEARVQDEGPGIAQAERELIFERFFRGTQVAALKAEGRVTSGTGLGLAIVRRVLELHGGEVLVEERGEAQPGASLLVRVPRFEK